jgi:cobalamin 5'-phosphate synthase/cobalamin synthase
VRGLLLAVQLLTRVPVPVRGAVTGADLARSAAWFPAVGALQGLLAAGAAWLLLRGFPAEVVAAMVVTLLVAVSGGLHLDGLADTFDALAVRATGDAGRDRERRLAAMKDSATGALGAAAIVLALLLKTLLLGALLSGGAAAAALALLVLAPVFAKWALLPALLAGVPARPDGLGRAFIELSTPGVLAAGTALAALLAAAGAAGAGLRPGAAAALAAAAFGALGCAALLVTRRCRRALGGITGDCLGAIAEIAEILFLAGAVLWTRHST